MRRWSMFIRALVMACAAGMPWTAAAQNHSDIWWNPAESGWGITIADHESQLFAVWYTYRPDGRPIWYVIPGGTFSEGKRRFQGDIYATTGPANAAPAFDASLVTRRVVGSATFDFAPAGLAPGVALFTYTVDGITREKQIQRQPFGSGAPQWGFDLTDIWWNAVESGWGLTLAQHGDNIFGVWFTYDTDGQPLWVVMPGVTFNAPMSFTGPLYTTTGPYFGAGAFDPNRVTLFPAGSATVTVGTPSSSRGTKAIGTAVFEPVFQGRTSRKLVSRQPFGAALPQAVPLTCSGVFNARLTLPSHCVPGGTRAFSSRVDISGVDWSREGSFRGDIRIDDFLLSLGSSSIEVYQGVIISAPCDLAERVMLEGTVTGSLAVGPAGTLVGSGTASFPLGTATFDFRVPGGLSVNGHVAYEYTLESRYRGLGEFSCIPQ